MKMLYFILGVILLVSFILGIIVTIIEKRSISLNDDATSKKNVNNMPTYNTSSTVTKQASINVVSSRGNSDDILFDDLII